MVYSYVYFLFVEIKLTPEPQPCDSMPVSSPAGKKIIIYISMQ